tara:strand:+ start:277 stop:1197 length:921 start_codon:yes stop_codon:yes gene_type:complete
MPGTKFSYGNKSAGIKGLRTKILAPALTSHYEVKIPRATAEQLSGNAAGALNKILDPILGTDGQENLNISCSEASLPGSQIATFEVKNDYAGVTERYAHRRMYDDRIDFTFYVDSNQYLPIRFFESWMKFVTGESGTRTDGETRELVNPGYHYRMNFPETYRCERGLKIVKFERDYQSSLEYEFIGAYPLSVASMPLSYESSNLLKCTVSMTYLRYVITELTGTTSQPQPSVPTQQPQQPNTQPPPVAQEKESKVQQNIIQNTGPEGEGLYDSATGARLLSTEQQLIEQGRVGDRLTPELAASLGT